MRARGRVTYVEVGVGGLELLADVHGDVLAGEEQVELGVWGERHRGVCGEVARVWIRMRVQESGVEGEGSVGLTSRRLTSRLRAKASAREGEETVVVVVELRAVV